MARRPSAASVSSLRSTSSLSKSVQLPSFTETLSPKSNLLSTKNHPRPSARAASLTSQSEAKAGLNGDASGLDPDGLFTKHTVAEIRAIQQQLRADANAKQEELRVMVGERYRDLLQASTSIISIAQSSNHVLNALGEMHAVSNAAGPSRIPHGPSSRGQEDTHLQALQSLSAHMKLLLDAPEYLWYLMEQKMYLHAAWLFLLSRVVHRALLRNDKEDDSSWHACGIDVVEQFPLIQRQWDTVSQFRSSITHKATLSLREYTPSSAEVCATLLTLHILESRPLTETLSILLAQRSKTLAMTLSQTHHRVPNGHPSGVSSIPRNRGAMRSRKTLMREVRQSSENLLDIVVRTLGTARDVFSQKTADRPALMSKVLQHIQSETPLSTGSLPPELQLTTQNLLATLPSSAHFLLLPPNIRSYKPYVDAESLASSVPQDQFQRRLDDWFLKSIDAIQAAIQEHFSKLANICEIWEVRGRLRDWIVAAPGLQPSEIAHINSILDSVCQQQATSVWKLTMSIAERAFREQLGAGISALEAGKDGSFSDAHPAKYLFQAPSLPPSSQAGLSPSKAAESFQRYKSALQKQLKARTPLLDGVVKTVEDCIQALHDDVKIMKGDDDDTRLLASRLADQYRSDAEMLCSTVISVLDAVSEALVVTSDLAVKKITFIARIAAELSAFSSQLITSGFHLKAVDAFRDKLNFVQNHMVERWQRYTVSQAIESHWRTGFSASAPLLKDDQNIPPRPSPGLIDALLSLTVSIQQFGAVTDPEKRKTLSRDTLYVFVSRVVDSMDTSKISARQRTQLYWDLAFLHQMVVLWDDARGNNSILLEKGMTRIREKSDGTAEGLSDVGGVMSTYLLRMQVLLDVLLPPPPRPKAPAVTGNADKPSGLLQFGLPVVEPQLQPTLELVKPSPRFGLLLVGSIGVR